MPRAVTITITIDNAGEISKQSIVVPTALTMSDAAIQANIDEQVANGSIKFIAYTADSQELDYKMKLGGFMSSTLCARFTGWGAGEEVISRNFSAPMIEHVLMITDPKPQVAPRPL